MKILDTLNEILQQQREMPPVKVEVDTNSIIKACAVVLAMLVLFLLFKKLL